MNLVLKCVNKVGYDKNKLYEILKELKICELHMVM